MANNRVAIRAAVKSMLVNVTDAGPNVFTNRETRLWESELPAILLSTGQEPVVHESLQGRRYYRTLELLVTVKITATVSVDDELDALVGQIEEILNTEPSFGGTVISSIQTNTEIRVNSEGKEDVAVAVLTFECKYIG